MDVEKLIRDGNYKAVVDHYRKHHPELEKDFLAFGISLFYMGLVDEALKIFEAGLKKYPDSVDLLTNLAEVYYQKQEIEKAFELAKKALKLGSEDPYLYDIAASYYEKVDMDELKKMFAEKAYNILISTDKDAAERVKKRYSIDPKKRKKLLIVGSCANYGDSFVKFIEEGWEIYVIKTSTWRSFESNYEVFAEIGAKLIPESELDEFIDNHIEDVDLVFRTRGFYGSDDAHRINRFYDIVHFEIIYKISKLIKENHLKGKIVVAFDGDTFVHDEFWSEWLSRRLQYVDWILFDTENLMRYFLKHVDINPSTKTKVMMVEVPLKRESRIDIHDSYMKIVLTMGRSLPSYIPVPKLFLKTLDARIAIGGGGGYLKRLREREIFRKVYGNIAYGMGYFHEFYPFNLSFDEILERDLEGYSFPTRYGSHLSLVYQFINVPGKVITYLQYGIIPILPRNGNDFYEELFKRNMAIPIEKDVDYFEPTDLSDEVISAMRRNILNNQDLFTFDPFFEFVTNEVLGGEGR